MASRVRGTAPRWVLRGSMAPEKTGRPRYVAEKLAPNGLRGSDVLCVISRSSSYPFIVIITMITTIVPLIYLDNASYPWEYLDPTRKCLQHQGNSMKVPQLADAFELVVLQH